MSQNGYAELQLWQEGPVGNSMVIMCEIYTVTRGNDFDQVVYGTLHRAFDSDNNTDF